MKSSRIQAGSVRLSGTRGWKSTALSSIALAGIALAVLAGLDPAAGAQPTSDTKPASSPSTSPIPLQRGATPDPTVIDARPGPFGSFAQRVVPPAPHQRDLIAPGQPEPVVAPVAAIEGIPGRGRQSYHLVATLNYAAATLDVVETLSWTNLAKSPVSSLNLSVIAAHAGAFSLSGPITVDGREAIARFAHFDTNLKVDFRQAVATGQTVAIVVPFRLVIGVNAGSLGGRLSDERGVLQFGDWFPIWSTVHGFNDVGDSQVTWKADSITLDIRATSEIGRHAVASSGQLQAGATDSHWVFVAHDVRNFAFAVDPAYKVAAAETSCGGRSIKVRAHAYHSSATELLARGFRALELYNGLFGCYPHPTFTLAEVGSPYFSMEFPTMVFIGSRVADDARIVYHEVAHQWWYGMVGNDQMAEPWLDESFAEFSAQLISGRVKYCSTRNVGSTIYDFGQWTGCDEYVDTVYERGADFLHNLRARMGDDPFFTALQGIVSTHDSELVTTAEVLNAFRAASPTNIDDLVAEYGL